MADGSSLISHQEPPQKTDWVILGMDGWIVGLVGLLATIGVAIWGYRTARNKTIQRKLIAKGNVAGGSIGTTSPNSRNVLQEDITADGDIAGGDIKKSK